MLQSGLWGVYFNISHQFMRFSRNIESEWRRWLVIQEQKHWVGNNLIACSGVFDENSTQQHSKSVVVGIDGTAEDYLVGDR